LKIDFRGLKQSPSAPGFKAALLYQNHKAFFPQDKGIAVRSAVLTTVLTTVLAAILTVLGKITMAVLKPGKPG
jgi:hypothetical protein